MQIIKERKLWLDALRGIAILLVVYGHVDRDWLDFFVFTSPIKMPLFFVISAYLFKPRGGCQVVFFKSILRKLVIPWIVLGMFPYTNPVGRFWDLLSGKALWFMPCLIIAELIWFYIHKFSKNDISVVFGGLTISFCGLLINHIHPIRYAMFDTSLIVQAFFVMGFLIHKYEKVLTKRWKNITPIYLFAYLFLGGIVLLYFPGECIDVHLNLYFNYPICSLMIIIGCLLMFTLFRSINLKPSWLVFVGQNTLVIYILHRYGFAIFQILMKMAGLSDMLHMPIILPIKAAFSCIICCIIAYLLNQYFPEIIGKNRKRGQITDPTII